MSLPTPATHESKGVLFYTGPDSRDYPGLAPYWALSNMAVNKFDGYLETDMRVDGERFDVRLNYHQSGIAPRDEDPIEASRLYEWDLSIDGHGERSGTYQISPRYPDLQHYEGGSLSTPFDHIESDEGISVQWNVSNFTLEEVRDLFPRAVGAVFDAADDSLNDRYLRSPAGGWIQEVELYVRILRTHASKIITEGGILDRLGMYLSNTKGVAGVHKFDNTEEMGYIHQFRTGSSGASEIIDHHTRGKQIKLYLPESPESFKQTDSLYHHKLGALFKKSLNGDDSVRWSDRESLLEELRETVFNVLDWSDIPLDTEVPQHSETPDEWGASAYVPDDHFRPSETLKDHVTLYDDPSPQLEAEQEALFLRTFQDITGSSLELVEAVATDGGKEVREFADEAGYHVSTVYRALEEMDEVLQCDNGHIEFVSKKLSEEIHAIVDSLRDRVESAADRASHLIDYEVRGSGTSSFERWLQHYGAEFEAPGDDDDDRPVVRIDTVLSRMKRSSAPLLEDVIEEMLLALKSDGRDLSEYEDLVLKYQLQFDGHKRTPLKILR